MFGFTGLSKGIFFSEKLPMYIDGMKAPIMMKEDRVLIPIICGTDLCQKVSRLLVAEDAFNGTNVTQLEGIGMPYDGLQSVGHMKGPSSSGRPM